MSSLDRRGLIKAGGLGLLALLANSETIAQDSPMTTTLRAMSVITGVQVSDQWLVPSAGLVSAIMDDSKPLRSLELGSIEPATRFQSD